MSKNVVWHDASVLRDDREGLNGHRGAVIWLTGLSGAGKSTLAHALDQALYDQGCHSYVLDGDNVRHGLCKDLGFSDADRTENIRRIGEMTKLFVDAGLIAITAFISPFREDRKRVRDLFEEGDFLEVFCRCSLNECERRDVKGLYKRARAGLIKEFTGITSPYQEPEHPELVLDTDQYSVHECARQLANMLRARGIIQSPKAVRLG